MTEGLQDNEPFLLGRWEIFPNLNRMVRGSEVRNLRPQVMNTLVYLVQRRGEVVSRDQMLERLWAGKVVSSASVYVTVAQLRHALEETEDIRLETIPRRGYRLLAPAPRRSWDSTAGVSQRPSGETEPDRPDDEVSSQLRPVIDGIGVALLIGITLGAGLLWTSFRSTLNVPNEANPVVSVSVPAASSAVPTIAVLPFRNMTAAEENAIFADGVHEEILTQLSRLPDVDVISRTSVMRFSEEIPSVPELARLLNATHLVEGSVRRAGNTVRVTVQLIDASSDKHLWSETFDRDLQDVFAIQTDVALRVADTLESTFSPRSLREMNAPGTDSLEAYDYYLQARQFDLFYSEAQVELLRLALEIDPDFAQAWQLLARVKSRPSHDGIDPDGRHLREAEEALRQAKRLAPDATDTMIAEAFVLYWGKQEFEAALRRVQAARAIEPRRAEFIELQAWIVRRLGRFDEFVDLHAQASRLDPLNADRARRAGSQAAVLDRYDEALEAYLRAYRADPEPGPGPRYELDVTRVFVSPDYAAWRRAQHALQSALAGSLDRFPDIHFGGYFIEHLYLTGQREQAWDLMGRRAGTVDTEDFGYGVVSAFLEVQALSFINEHEAARDLAERVLAAYVEMEGHPDTRALVSSQSALPKAWLGRLLGHKILVAENLAFLRQDIETARDPYQQLRATEQYLEALAPSDPAMAQQVFLNGDTRAVPIHEFAVKPQAWYPLLESIEVRALFDDHPDWVQFMRDRWPESREFPFD